MIDTVKTYMQGRQEALREAINVVCERCAAGDPFEPEGHHYNEKDGEQYNYVECPAIEIWKLLD